MEEAKVYIIVEEVRGAMLPVAYRSLRDAQAVMVTQMFITETRDNKNCEFAIKEIKLKEFKDLINRLPGQFLVFDQMMVSSTAEA